ncbi:hypothetical protein [Ornithinimicrobium kibberense]|uniref:hypothetical protein n=1 Tax=Ornithinimicrobium kibberense TaxID=282060 RepID=UPI00362368F9
MATRRGGRSRTGPRGLLGRAPLIIGSRGLHQRHDRMPLERRAWGSGDGRYARRPNLAR